MFMCVRMCPDMSGQEKREMNKGEKPKKARIRRFRKRLHTTVSPETYEFLTNKALNAGKLLDNAVSELQTKTTVEMVLICQNKPERWARGDSNARSSPCEGDVMTS